jgi:hypothetical protein
MRRNQDEVEDSKIYTMNNPMKENESVKVGEDTKKPILKFDKNNEN